MIDNISFGVGVIAVAVILWGVLIGVIQILRYEYIRLGGQPARRSLNQIRHIVASYLLLGLEFLIAADILRTVSDRSLEDLAILGGLVVIRTVISFFLGRETGSSRPLPGEGSPEKSSG